MFNLQKTIGQIYDRQKLYIEHLDNQFLKYKMKSNQSNQSFKFFKKFFENLLNENSKYLSKLNSLHNNNKKNYESNIKDNYLTELFKDMLNSFSKMIEDLEQKQEIVQEQFKFFEQGLKKYDEDISNFSIHYQDKIKVTSNELSEQQNYYQQYLNSHKKVEQRTSSQRFIKQSLYQKVENLRNQAQMFLVKFEVDMKENSYKLKDQIIVIKDKENSLAQQLGQKIRVLFQNSNIDQESIIQLKSFLEKNKYETYYKDILSRICCQFSKDIYLGSSSSNLYSYEEMIKLTEYLNGNFLQNIMQKINKISNKIDARIKIFIDLILEKIFKQEQIDQKINIEKLHLILENKNGLDYFIYKMYLNKVIITQSKLFKPIQLNQFMFEFLEKIFKLILFLVHDYYNEITENIYSFMKFASCLKDKNHKTILNQMSQQIIFLQKDFWLKIFNYVDDQIYNSSDNNITQNLKSFFFKENNHKKNMKNQAFQETASTMFQTQLNYNKICENLVYIATNQNINLQSVQLLLFRNMDLFNEQISTYYINEQLKNTKYKKLNKEKKILQVFKYTLKFLNKDELKIFTKQIYLNKKIKENLSTFKLQKWILQSITNLNKQTRIFLLQQVVNQNLTPINMIEDYDDIDQTESDQIINLDVQRTFNHDKQFDKKGLEIILKNIACEKIGSFSYYQGLNYIVAYFYILFDQNNKNTFNFVMPLVQKYFVSYMDQKLEGLKRLLFIHKKLLKIYFPKLNDYFQLIVDIDTDIIFPSWCLTLFCAINQYNGDSYLLDDVIDIFVAKGWSGYFQIVMVIMDELKEEIQSNENEQLLILFSELPKSNFELITKNYKEKFNFKSKIHKYKSIDKFLIGSLSLQYNILLEKKSDFWHSFQKQTSLSSTDQIIQIQQIL